MRLTFINTIQLIATAAIYVTSGKLQGHWPANLSHAKGQALCRKGLEWYGRAFRSFQATLADIAKDPVFYLAALVVLLLWALPSIQSQKLEGPALLAPSNYIFCSCQLPRFASMAGCIVLTSFQARQ